MLDSDAKAVLIATCVPDTPVSKPEIEAMTGLSQSEFESAIIQLQKLFLVPKPRLIESEERFDVNQNTRWLVRELFSQSDVLRSIRGAYRSLSGDQVAIQRRRIGEYVAQAVALVRQDRHRAAEETLLAGIEKYPNNTDLLAQLGWVYRRWKPRARITDAREMFNRASALQCHNEQMYRHWSEMEADESEWTLAAAAAESGLALLPDSRLLRFSAGYARSRLGRELRNQVQPRAMDELATAWSHLSAAVCDPTQLLDYSDRRLQSKAFRSLVVTADMLISVSSNSDAAARLSHDELKNPRRIARDALAYLHRWNTEHPDDSYASSERERLEPRFRAILGE
jgi:hypothetical protein